MKPLHYYNLPYAELFVFEHFVISQIKDGTVLQPENNNEMAALLKKHFSDTNWVYIANRIFEYNVSPLTYKETSKISNLIGMCIVTESHIGQNTARFESKFYSKEFEILNSIPEAIVWATELVNKSQS